MIKMQVPKPGILQLDSLHAHVLTTIDKQQAWPLHLEVGALGFFFPALPKCRPKNRTTSVQSSRTTDAHAIHALDVHQGHPPRFKMPFNPRQSFRIILNILRTFQHRTFLQKQLDLGLEENRSASKNTGGNYHHSAAFLRRRVDRRLHRGRVQCAAVSLRAVSGNQKLLLSDKGQRRQAHDQDPTQQEQSV